MLGEAPCPVGRCIALFDTSDGGVSWAAATAPPFSVSPSSPSFDAAAISFVNTDDGWAYDTSETQVGGGTGDQLFSTHDGGRDWAPVTLDDGDASRVDSLADGDGHVWVIAFDESADEFAIYGSPVGEDVWSRSALSLPLGAAPDSTFSTALEGARGWIVESDRGIVAGAELRNDGWSTWTPPCDRATGLYDDEALAGIGPSLVVALCPPNPYADAPPPTALFASRDGGASFHLMTSGVPSAAVGLAASPDGALFTVDGQGLAASFDGGATWQTVLGFGGSTFPYPRNAPITFVTSEVGYAVVPSGELSKTVDGGHRWQSVRLPST